jgi:site-specific recombinase XerD
MKDDFPQLVEGFFLQWMDAGRHLSAQTIASYRDAFSLLLRWLRDERGIPASEKVQAFFAFARLTRKKVLMDGEQNGMQAQQQNTQQQQEQQAAQQQEPQAQGAGAGGPST